MIDPPLLYVAPVAAAALLAWTLIRATASLDIRPVAEAAAADVPRLRAAVVINPSKFVDPDRPKTIITAVCRELGWADPLILETTREDPGTSMTREALAAGAEVVMACGGDGTVRRVAEVLAGTGTPMGLLPAGTANLLARNLDLPLDDLPTDVRIALTGRDHPVDVGWFRIDSGQEHAFLVMAGVGFDAEIMLQAPEELKARVGFAAYVVSGVRNLNGPREKVRIVLDDATEIGRRVRSVIIGNCGKLHANIDLMPDARIDDGLLDTLVLSPRGVVGWAAVAGEVVTRHQRGHRLIERYQSREVSVQAGGPLSAQVDGDPIGETETASARVEAGALILRMPPAG